VQPQRQLQGNQGGGGVRSGFVPHIKASAKSDSGHAWVSTVANNGTKQNAVYEPAVIAYMQPLPTQCQIRADLPSYTLA
jgi:hypothetical protein